MSELREMLTQLLSRPSLEHLDDLLPVDAKNAGDLVEGALIGRSAELERDVYRAAGRRAYSPLTHHAACKSGSDQGASVDRLLCI
jgi:hypothetical protein